MACFFPTFWCIVDSDAIRKTQSRIFPSRQVDIQKTYKRHSALNIQKTSNFTSAGEPQKAFSFEPSLKVQICMFNVSICQLQKTRKYWFTFQSLFLWRLLPRNFENKTLTSLSNYWWMLFYPYSKFRF